MLPSSPRALSGNLLISNFCENTMASHTGVVPFLISLLSYILLGPFIILFVLINEISRLLVTLCLELNYNGEIWLVPDGNDGVWSTKRPGHTRMALSMIRYAGNTSRESIINILNDKVRPAVDADGDLENIKLEYILIHKWGYACWKRDGNFEMRDHVRFLDHKVYAKRELKELLQELAEDMDPCRPQWEIVVVPQYKEEGEEVHTGWIILRFNHGFGDGLSLMMMLQRYLLTNFTYYLDPINFKVPSWKKYLYYLNSLLHGPYAILTILKNKSKQFWPTLESSEVSIMERNYTWSRNVNLDHVRTIRQVTDKTTIQSIVQNAFISAAIQVLPKSRIPEEWVICEIAALLPYQNDRPQNRFTGFLYSINSEGDDFTRLRESKKAAWEGMTGPFIPMVYALVSIVGRMPVMLHSITLDGAFSTFVFSNVPLSKTKVFALDNVEGLEMIGYPPQPNDTGIVLLSSTYNNNVKIAAVARSDWIRKEELEDIIGRIPSIVEDWANKAEKIILQNGQ